MREIRLRAEPEGGDLEYGGAEKGNHADGKFGGEGSTNNAQNRPARDEDGKDGLRGGEISSDEVNQVEEVQPNQGHE